MLEAGLVAGGKEQKSEVRGQRTAPVAGGGALFWVLGARVLVLGDGGARAEGGGESLRLVAEHFV